MSDFDIESPLPKPIKYALIMIDRVGFPIFAFCLMAYMCFVALGKMNYSVEQNTIALINLTHQINTSNHYAKNRNDAD